MKELARARLETTFGEGILIVYRQGTAEHKYYILGNTEGLNPLPVRIHSSCFTGDVLSSTHCDCGEQLDQSLKIMNERGGGALLYLDQEGRGIGLAGKLKAYGRQEQGMDTVDANIAEGYPVDAREYTEQLEELRSLIGDVPIALLTNNPNKLAAAKKVFTHAERESLVICPKALSARAQAYVSVKRARLDHLKS